MRERNKGGLPDIIIFIVTLALLGIGIIMVFSSSSVMAFHEEGDAYFYLKRQALWAGMGLIALLILMNIDYRTWKKFSILAIVGVIALLILVLVPGIGVVVGGARRWIGVGAFRIQPSEFAKMGLILFLSSYLSSIGDKVRTFKWGIIPPILVTGIICLLILKEPDLGTVMALAGISFIMIFMSGCNIFHMVYLGLLSIPAIAYLIWAEPYRMRRFFAFLDPWADPLDSGFHIIQSLLALGSGGIFGLGLGMSRQKFHYLPEQHTDFIFAILGEELGFIGAFGVVLLYIVFAWRGYRIAMNCKDRFGSLMAAGITTMIVLQAIINLGVVSGLLPVTGITLPLISSGGSSLLPMLASIGILLNISKTVESVRK